MGRWVVMEVVVDVTCCRGDLDVLVVACSVLEALLNA
jgi:hypothetical protein